MGIREAESDPNFSPKAPEQRVMVPDAPVDAAELVRNATLPSDSATKPVSTAEPIPLDQYHSSNDPISKGQGTL